VFGNANKFINFTRFLIVLNHNTQLKPTAKDEELFIIYPGYRNILILFKERQRKFNHTSIWFSSSESGQLLVVY
jgi:hypothetical protein